MSEGGNQQRWGQTLWRPYHLDQKSTHRFNKMMVIGDLLRILERGENKRERGLKKEEMSYVKKV